MTTKRRAVFIQLEKDGYEEAFDAMVKKIAKAPPPKADKAKSG